MQILWTVKKTAHQDDLNDLSAKCGKTKQIFIQKSKKQNRSPIISGWEEEVGYFKKEQSYPAKTTHNFPQSWN